MVSAPAMERRRQDRAERHDRIVTTARELAETEGWDAVTTRRLADAIGYSQPVLYGHFPGGRAEVMTAVALAGFRDLAVTLTTSAAGRAAVRAVAKAYLDFAAANPATYEAMFTRPIQAQFAGTAPPAELLAAFEVLSGAIAGVEHPPRDLETATEVFWGSLHGLATLDGSARLRPSARARRLTRLVDATVGAGISAS